jgi:hypothetical protein
MENTMKLTVAFAPADKAVHAALRELIPPDGLDDLLFELQAKADTGDRSAPKYHQELSYEETPDILREVEKIVGRLPNHDETCQSLSLRRTDVCDCDLGRLSRLMKRLPLRHPGSRQRLE